jgi:hypothetical protein
MEYGVSSYLIGPVKILWNTYNFQLHLLLKSKKLKYCRCIFVHNGVLLENGSLQNIFSRGQFQLGLYVILITVHTSYS